ncbi:hypothetical protein GGI20_002570 [Coemansia sp. BCRC 34301]|nr:hypothetical protein GGI20_002570 [Coemansia sp. BCRC 34301]
MSSLTDTQLYIIIGVSLVAMVVIAFFLNRFFDRKKRRAAKAEAQQAMSGY